MQYGPENCNPNNSCFQKVGRTPNIGLFFEAMYGQKYFMGL